MSIQPPETRPDAGPPGFRRRGRIVFTLLAVLVFIGLAPLATVAWKLIDINREALTTSQQEYQLLLASTTAQKLEIHVEGLRAPLVRLAQTLGGAIRRHDASGEEETRRILEDVVDDRTLYLRFTYFRGQGVRSISAGTLPPELEGLFASGLRDAAEVLAGGGKDPGQQTRLSEPLLMGSDPARAVLVVSAPIVSGGKFRGVLSALVDLQTVWESVIDDNRTGHVVFAVDREGRVFATNNPSLVPLGADARSSKLVDRFLAAKGRMIETMPFVLRENGNEVRYLGSFKPTELGWGIFVQARMNDVYLPVQSMVRSTKAWASAALALAVVAAIIFAGTLSRPAKRLAAASRAFAAGDFSRRVEVRSGNEIGELAYTFNRMATEIEDHIRRLRQAAEENKELFLGTIRALAQAIDAKDPYTRGHSVRVNRYSVILARQLGLSEKEIGELHVASLMHDVGKIGIDDKILKKNGALTDEEYEIIKTHPVLGANIMAPIRRMEPMVPGLRWHHERWGGGGYPDGLEAEQIPLMARIVAVADAFDAMTTHRPYQTAMTFPKALQRLNDLKTVAFEDKIVEAFNRAYRQGLIRPDPEEQDSVVAAPTAIPA